MLKNFLKLVLIIFLSINFSTFANALSQQQAINTFFSKGKLDKIEGIWIDDDGYIEAYVKRGSSYQIYRISGKKSGKVTGEFSGSGDNYRGKAYLSGGVINTCNLKINLSSDNFGRWKCGKYNLTISRAWPSDLASHNQQFNQNNSASVSSGNKIDQAKQVCKDLGFNPKSEKFADCALKMYSMNFEVSNKSLGSDGSSTQQVIVKDKQDYEIWDLLLDISAATAPKQKTQNQSSGTNCKVYQREWGADVVCQ